MNMKTNLISDCMVTDVASCRPETSMEQAAHLMWEHDCGILPVTDEGQRVIGVVTDRDLAMAAYTRGRALHDLYVGESMSSEVHTCRPTDSLEEALDSLGEHRVRRLPIVDEDGRLEGILALNDLVRFVDTTDDQGAKRRLSKLLLSSMASICAARLPATRQPSAPATRRRQPRGTLVES